MSAASLPLPDRKAHLWPTVGLGAVLTLAAWLHFFRLDQEGFANLYYAAGVRSMLQSWSNFFFVSFDPAGFVSIDKPPLGLWVQTASAWVFGFQGWSLLFPQALAGVLSVALLYHLVARRFGSAAGIIAALGLTLTPISIAANRNNTMDSLLVLTLLLAAWAAFLAAERGKLSWLLLASALVGIGFNIKMLQAFMILPAVYLLYFMAAPSGLWKRSWHLALASGALLVISLSWAVVVDLTPADNRPYVGSSTNNSVLELTLGHNGIARLGVLAEWLGLRPAHRAGTEPAPVNRMPTQPAQGNRPAAPPPPIRPQNLSNRPAASQPPPGGQMNDETGQPGLFRLFNRQLAGQISWLLPLAGFGLLAAWLETPFKRRLSLPHQALLFWAAWLIPQAFFFSFAGLFHRYYLEMIAPAIAALVAAGVVSMWRGYRDALYIRHKAADGDPLVTGNRAYLRAWLLPFSLLLTLVGQLYILRDYPELSRWMTGIMAAIGLLAILLLKVLLVIDPRKDNPKKWGFVSVWLTAAGMFALWIAPAVWALIPVWYGGDNGLPYAGPDLLNRPGRNQNQLVQPLVDYLLAQHGTEKYLLAALNAQTAAPIILATGAPVMALGGFSGSDQILDLAEIQQKVSAGEIRFFLIPPNPNPFRRNSLGQPNPIQPQPGPPVSQQTEWIHWVVQSCQIVPGEEWNMQANAPRSASPAPGRERVELWDCR